MKYWELVFGGAARLWTFDGRHRRAELEAQKKKKCGMSARATERQ